MLVGPWSYTFVHNVPFVIDFSLSGNIGHLLSLLEWKADQVSHPSCCGVSVREMACESLWGLILADKGYPVAFGC